MEFKEGWLLRQIEAASKEVASWPEWKKAAYKIREPQEASDRSDCCNASVDWRQSTRYGMTFWCRSCGKVLSSDGDYSC